jgi:hypothetical protein
MKDYFIVYFLKESSATELVPAKQFFWCLSTNFIFSSLPKPNADAHRKLGGISAFFTGEFD